MKKLFFLCLIISILSSHTGKAYAGDRLVTSYILSDKWYENIFLIADKADSMATKNFTVQIGGSSDSVGGELLYHFPHWYNEKFAPKLFYDDINGDGLKDVIVSLISGSGSGVSTKEIHVLNQVEDPNRRYVEAPVESINEAMKRLVKVKRKGNKIKVRIGKKEYVVDYLKFGYQHSDAPPGVGSIEEYKPENGVLYGNTVVFVSIPEAAIGRLKVKYDWDGEMYRAEEITFEEEKVPQVHGDGSDGSKGTSRTVPMEFVEFSFNLIQKKGLGIDLQNLINDGKIFLGGVFNGCCSTGNPAMDVHL